MTQTIASSTSSIKGLLVEDNPGDVELVRTWIEEDAFRPVSVESARTLAAARDLIRMQHYDVILLDLGLPDFSGIQTFSELKKYCPGIPVIILTGNDDIALATECINLGAQDYLIKGHIQGFITHAIHNTVSRAALTQALCISYENYRKSIEEIRDATLILDTSRKVLFSNKAALKLFGTQAEEGNTLDLAFDFSKDEIEIVSQERGIVYADIRQGETNWYGQIASILTIRDNTEKKIAEKALKKEKIFTDLLIETAKVMILLFDAEGNIIFANQNFNDTTKFLPEEIIWQDLFREIIPESGGVKGSAGEWQFFRGMNIVRAINRLLSKDGKNIDIEWTLSELKEPESDTVRTLAIGHDITERKRMDDALRESNEYLDSLISSTNAPIIVWDTQLKITRFNHAFETLTCRKAETVLGKDINLLFPENRKEECLGYIRQATMGERWDAIEIPIMSKDGSVHIVLWSSATILGPDERTIIATIAQGQDITSRILAEETIRMSESRLRRLVDILQHPCETIQDFLDYALEQAIQLTGSKIGYIYHYIEDCKKFVLNTWSKDVMRECTVAHSPTTYELDKTGFWGEAVRQRRPIVANDFQTANPLKKGTPDGHVQLLKYMTIPIFREGEIVGVVGLANKETDYDETNILQTSLLMEAVWKVVDRKKAEEELRTLNSTLDLQIQQRTQELQAANKELEAFSYSVSHDLRAPLRSIEGFSEIFLNEYGTTVPEKGREYLERVRQNVLHMGELIEDLLQLSKLTNHPLSLEMTDLTALATIVSQELAADDPDRDVRMQIEQGMKAVVDPHLLRIVLTNLIGNAWKFTSKREHASICVGTLIDPQHGSAFFVRDNGAGFDNAYKDKLFSAFQRLHQTTEFSGTGIGLATIARIVRRHGGDVWAEGEVDKGATFYFTIPEQRSGLQ